jgi:hypothetical protein
MAVGRYSDNGSIVGTSVHCQACKNYAGNCCLDSGLSEDLIVGPVVKLVLSMDDYSARYVSNDSPAQRGHSAYIRPLSLPRRVTPYLISETRFPNGSKGGEREDDGHQVASVVASESKYAGAARFRCQTRANYPWSDLKGDNPSIRSTILLRRAGSSFNANIRSSAQRRRLRRTFRSKTGSFSSTCRNHVDEKRQTRRVALGIGVFLPAETPRRGLVGIGSCFADARSNTGACCQRLT